MANYFSNEQGKIHLKYLESRRVAENDSESDAEAKALPKPWQLDWPGEWFSESIENEVEPGPLADALARPGLREG